MGGYCLHSWCCNQTGPIRGLERRKPLNRRKISPTSYEIHSHLLKSKSSHSRIAKRIPGSISKQINKRITNVENMSLRKRRGLRRNHSLLQLREIPSAILQLALYFALLTPGPQLLAARSAAHASSGVRPWAHRQRCWCSKALQGVAVCAWSFCNTNRKKKGELRFHSASLSCTHFSPVLHVVRTSRRVW